MKALNIIKVLVSLLFILILLVSFSGKEQESAEAEEEIETQLIELEKSLYFLGHDKAVQETWVEDINEALQETN